MPTEVPKGSRVAALLESYGVGTRISIRAAAKLTGLSHETISRLMRPTTDPRRIRTANLDKLANGLGIPRDLLEREMMHDWGYAQAAEGPDSEAEVLAMLRDFTPAELASLQQKISEMQVAKLNEEKVGRPQKRS